MNTTDFYLLRPGMILRKYMASQFFDPEEALDLYPEYITKHYDGAIRGTPLLYETLDPEDIPLDTAAFIQDSPDFYLSLVHEGQKQISAKEAKTFKKFEKQYTNGLKSGALKHDSRGFYLSSRVDRS